MAPTTAATRDLLVLFHGVATPDDVAKAIEALRSLDGMRCVAVFADEEAERAHGSTLAAADVPLVAYASSVSGIDRLRQAVETACEADVLVLRAGVVVAADLVRVLRATAFSDSTTATVSGIFVTERRAGGASEGSETPAIAAPLWDCAYVRRDAVDLGLSLASADVPASTSLVGALEAVVLLPGFVHRLGTFVGGTAPIPRPHLTDAATRRMVGAVEAASGELRVVIDLRCCALPMSGTQVQVLELVYALAAQATLKLGVLLPERIDRSVRAAVAQLPPHVNRHTEGTYPDARPHVFHRPYQLFFDWELGDVVRRGDRLVITQQDMILSRNPRYFHSAGDWRRLNDLTQTSFLAADHVAFFSPHAMSDALSDGFLSKEKASVVPLGIDHSIEVTGDAAVAPAVSLGSDERPYLLVLGNAYLHKNRLFALQLFESIERQTSWNGRLVFAGRHPPFGGSGELERRYRRKHLHLAERVIDIGPVSESAKQSLYAGAALVIYPTLYEGFGLVPFEAAAARTPTVYALRAALADFLPPAGAVLDGWDVDASARRIHSILTDDQAAMAIVEAIRDAGRLLTWERTARGYVGLYHSVMTKPAGFSLALGEFALGPATAALTPNEQQLIKAYRRSGPARAAIDSLVNAAVAARRWLTSKAGD